MYKLEIKLKQHTPLIHFQHDQEGATLRASEVKPKLDKYIIKHAFHDNFNECKQYLVGYNPKTPDAQMNKFESGYRALNYKMSIYTPSVENRNIGEKEKIPMYFGNMSNENKKGISYSTEIFDLVFFTAHQDLLDKIEENYHTFFLLNNFGSRQSKGYGSFLPLDSSVTDIIKSNSYFYFNYRPREKLPISSSKSKDFSFLFQQIDLFYKTIRSGINQEGCYFKSMMYHYAKYQQEYWDKRAIRHNFELFTATESKKELFRYDLPNKQTLDLGEKTDEINDQENGKKNSTARLYRDVLGLSTSQEWMKYGATIKKENLEIERFKSPILIKPLYDSENNKYVVIIIPLTVDKDYLGKRMAISIEYKEKESSRNETNEDKQRREALMAKRKQRNQQSMEMDLPDSFEVEDYLRFIFKGEGKVIVERQINKMPDTIIKWNWELRREEVKPNYIKNSLKRIYNLK